MQEHCKVTLTCKCLSRCLLCKNCTRYRFFLQKFERYLHLQECCKMSNFCRTLESYIIIATISRNLSITCKNVARYLIFAGFVQEFHYLQEFRKKSNDCKTSAEYLFVAFSARDVQVTYYLQESLEKSSSCKSPSRYLFSLQKSFKITVIWKSLVRYLLFARFSILARYILFAGVSRDIYNLQDFCQISVVSKNPASYVF